MDGKVFSPLKGGGGGGGGGTHKLKFYSRGERAQFKSFGPFFSLESPTFPMYRETNGPT